MCADTYTLAMCGIAGLFDPSRGIDDALRCLREMGDAIRHRGPDDHGEWWAPEIRAGLSHRRLSILDVSAAGHQPMVSACGNWVIAFNGEVYNHQELRQSLERESRHVWRGHSDTEVVLACIAQHGFQQSLPRLSGMFAIAAVDIRNRRLWLATDRAGKKPLYYGWVNGIFGFASELKALRSIGRMPEADRDAVALFLRYGYIPAPHTIHRGLRKLPQGCFASIPLASTTPGDAVHPNAYWSIDDVVRAGKALRPEERADPAMLESVLEAAVRRRLVADVPVGAFLSGGVDSSIVSALMARNARGRVSTFSIGFEDPALDESRHALAVARHLGTEHTNHIVSDTEMRAVVPMLPAMFDEPFADSSQIPTYLVSRLARSRVTVSLSGDGGDELFGGYDRYREAIRTWSALHRVPAGLRRAGASALVHAAPLIRAFDRWTGLSHRSGRGSVRALLRSPSNAAEVLRAPSFQAMYRRMVSTWSVPPVAGLCAESVASDPLLDLGFDPDAIGQDCWMMLADFRTYLPGDILVKVDRASMAESLEVRCPFLDSEVVAFAWSLADEHRIHPPRLKVALHDLACRLVPREVVERPKMGFGVPLARWLRGPLRAWMLDTLSEAKLRRDGLLDAGPVRASLDRLLAGADSEQSRVWATLMLCDWLESQRR